MLLDCFWQSWYPSLTPLEEGRSFKYQNWARSSKSLVYMWFTLLTTDIITNYVISKNEKTEKFTQTTSERLVTTLEDFSIILILIIICDGNLLIHTCRCDNSQQSQYRHKFENNPWYWNEHISIIMSYSTNKSQEQMMMYLLMKQLYSKTCHVFSTNRKNDQTNSV